MKYQFKAGIDTLSPGGGVIIPRRAEEVERPAREHGEPSAAQRAKPARSRSALSGSALRIDSALQTIGRLAVIAVQCFRFLAIDLVRLQFPGREALNQAAFLVKVTVMPAFLMSVPFGVIISVQVNSLVRQLGAVSMAGAIGGLGVMQQGAPLIAALLLGGAAGAAVATDLGARSIREEIDALLVMGVNPVRRLAVPRLAAVIVVAPLLSVFVIFIGLAVSYIIAVSVQGSTPGSFMASFAAFARPADMVVALVKSLLFGIVAILIACQRGLEAKGGAKAVADAANATVVLGVISIVAMNLALTELTSLILPARLG